MQSGWHIVTLKWWRWKKFGQWSFFKSSQSVVVLSLKSSVQQKWEVATIKGQVNDWIQKEPSLNKKKSINRNEKAKPIA